MYYFTDTYFKCEAFVNHRFTNTKILEVGLTEEKKNIFMIENTVIQGAEMLINGIKFLSI